MKFVKVICGAALAISCATSANAQEVSEMADCKFTNKAVMKTLYEGACEVTQSMHGEKTHISVKMGDTDPFVFSGVRGEETWMYDSEEVAFEDLPEGGFFRWSTFVLVVAE